MVDRGGGGGVILEGRRLDGRGGLKAIASIVIESVDGGRLMSEEHGHDRCEMSKCMEEAEKFVQKSDRNGVL
jgi:hypothetical protein